MNAKNQKCQQTLSKALQSDRSSPVVLYVHGGGVFMLEPVA
jgi:acetyl esterase/lipase